MKKTTGMLLAMLILLSCCGTAFAETAGQENAIYWADVAKEANEPEKAGEFLPIGDWDLMMWIPSNMKSGEMTDEDGEKGLVAYFSTDDGSASLKCVWDRTFDKGLADRLKEVKSLGYAPDNVTINGLKCISWTESGNDCMKVLFIPDDGSAAITLVFSPMSDKSFSRTAEIMKHSLMSSCVFYENEGLLLPVANRVSELVTVDTPKDDEYGELFSVSETASIEAAAATGQDFDGAGWLFGIARVTEDELHEMLCYFMFGSDVFARDEDGMYYLFNHPTDVRIVRESYDNMEDDMEIWSELNQWAWQEKANFLAVNPGIHAAARGNSDPEIFLARTAWMKDEPYTISTTEAGPREPGKVDPVPYVEKLTTNVFMDELYDAEAPDGEYVVLTLPNEQIRLDFFLAKGSENIIRLVTDDGRETLWQAEYEDGTTKASAVMQEWYKALAN